MTVVLYPHIEVFTFFFIFILRVYKIFWDKHPCIHMKFIKQFFFGNHAEMVVQNIVYLFLGVKSHRYPVSHFMFNGFEDSFFRCKHGSLQKHFIEGDFIVKYIFKDYFQEIHLDFNRFTLNILSLYLSGYLSGG